MKNQNYKNQSDDMNSGKVLLGVLAGAAAGALLGVLLAPERGSITRGKIAQLGDDYAGDITDKIRELRDSITERLDALRSDGNGQLADRAKEEVKNVLGGTNTGGRSSGSSTGSTGSSGYGGGGGFSSGPQTL
jgi:gas vesicle protein